MVNSKHVAFIAYVILAVACAALAVALLVGWFAGEKLSLTQFIGLVGALVVCTVLLLRSRSKG